MPYPQQILNSQNIPGTLGYMNIPGTLGLYGVLVKGQSLAVIITSQCFDVAGDNQRCRMASLPGTHPRAGIFFLRLP